MKLQMKVTAFHMVDNLSAGLYSNSGQCLAELVRNSLVASMPPDVWDPKRARIDISLVSNHPLSKDGEDVLLILDHGCGLTDPALERYFNWLGTPLKELRNSIASNGASQKGIGRLAALALNTSCMDENVLVKIKNGYYLFTRTSRSGSVRFIPVIPEKAEAHGGFETENFISPTSTEMGSLKNIQGTFTALVIPTPVFRSHDEIYEAIKWYLPREHDKMFNLTIGGKEVLPPPLEQKLNMTSVDGNMRARLGVGIVSSDGAWLCDADTGLRVASCQQLGRALPEPLWYPDLVGDIFAPRLLRHQNTARNTLSREFMRKSNKDWNGLQMFLISQVAPAAKQLIERDIIRGDAADTLNELAQMFKEAFGEPVRNGEVYLGQPVSKKPHVPRTEPIEPVDEPLKPKDKYQRYICIRVRDETYNLYRGQSLHPYIFAQLNPNNAKMIIVNVRGGYKALPDTKAARREHCLMQILSTIGQSKYPSDNYQAIRFANEVRSELLKK
jgi:hypothetical protein